MTTLQVNRDWHWEGLKYLQWCLCSGPPLSVELEKLVAGSEGVLDAYVPEGHQVASFRWGGHGEIASCRSAIVEACEQFLEEPGRVVVFEHSVIRPDDPRGFLVSHVRIRGDTVYQIALSGLDNHSDIPAIVKHWVSIPICMAAFFEIGETLVSQELAAENDSRLNLEGLLGGLRKVLVGAYDGEGFLVWSLRSPPAG